MSDQTHSFRTISAPADAMAEARPRAGDDRLLVWLAGAALLLGIARRMCFGWDDPLDLDETWTGAIANAPNFATLIQRCLSELSGPVFYGSEWLWAKLAGLSDAALRAPGVAASIAAPLLILWAGHPERRVRLLWAGMAATWLPGTLFAAQARPYSLVVLLATAQVITLARLLRDPTTAKAFAWSSVTGLMLLCHYSPLPLVALQGLAILTYGQKVWRCRPALLAFVPVAAWMAFHLHTVLAFAAPGVAWYPVYRWSALADVVPAAMFGLASLGIALLATIAGTTAWSALPAGPREVRAFFDRGDVIIALSGIGAVLIVAVMATLRPSFSPRYLLGFMPAVLFGVALWASAWSRRWPLLSAILLGGFMLLAAGEARLRLTSPPDRDHGESFEAAAQMIAEEHPRRLFALFDGSATSDAARPLLREVGGFFFARDGHPIAVQTPILAGTRADPNRILPALADRPDDAILWIYNAGMRGTRGAEFPAAIPQYDPRWSCRDYGVGALAVIACTQTRAPK